MVHSVDRQFVHRLWSTVIALLAVSAAQTHAQTPIFTKTLAKVNGAAVSSNPASLTNGDILDWVLTYEYNPSAAQPAQTDIKDTLSPRLQYVPGFLQVPPSWTKQWLSGSTWGATEAGATGVGAVINFPNVTPIGAGQTALIPAPPAASINTAAGGGDGYRAIPYNGDVYVVNHHTTGTYLDCFVAVSGVRCTGYEASASGSIPSGYHVPVTGRMPFNKNRSDTDNYTPGQPIEYLDRVNGKLYYPVIKSASQELGILCADLISKKSCGFNGFSTFGTSPQDYMSIQGIGAVGTRVYAQLRGNKIGCIDTASAPTPCAGQPYSSGVTAAVPGSGVYNDSSEIVGQRIYSLWQSRDSTTPLTPFSLTCFDTISNLPCQGWGPKNPDSTGIVAILYPLLDSVNGICVHTTNPPSDVPPPSTPPPTSFQCYELVTGAGITPPATYATWVQTFGGGWYQSSGYGQPGQYKPRVFSGRSDSVAVGNPGFIGCYDFTPPAAACVGAGWPVTGSGVTNQHYATISDPERPGCMWYYGNDGKLGSFQAADGLPCSGSTILDTVVKPADSYCAGDTTIGWDMLSVTGLTLGGGVTAKLTLYDGNSPGSLAVNIFGVPYAQNLPVSSLPLTLGSGGLGIGYSNGVGVGDYRSLRVVLQFSGITTGAPWTQSPPPSVEVSWLGGPPQFCFRTKVTTCDSGPVTNQATAVTSPANGSPINSLAPPTPFSALHVLGAECSSSTFIEICKSSSLTNPVAGNFTFTATNGTFTSPPIFVPVGVCSGPIPVPAGAVKITEAPASGVGVNAITAYGYNATTSLLENRLMSSDLTNRTAIVSVQAGSIGSESVVEFTNATIPTGVMEVCKDAAPGTTVTGSFSFNVSGAPRNPYLVLAGACSGPILVQAGSVTVTELPRAGFSLVDVETIPINRLVSLNILAGSAVVTVNAADITAETVVRFLNSPATGTGQLKICKVAGAGVVEGQNFTITANNVSYTVPAGPAATGGFCVLDGTFPIGTAVTVQENPPSPYQVLNMTVNPPNRAAGAPILVNGNGQATVTIGTGFTEVTVTNIGSTPTGQLKICKVADAGVPVGTNFTFSVAGAGATGSTQIYTVPAGPVGEGGYCVVDGTFPVGTRLTVTELPSLPYGVTGIAVNGTPLLPNGTPSATIKILGGITEVAFTNQIVFFDNGGGVGSGVPFLNIVNYQLVSREPAPGGLSSVTYRADLLNTGTGFNSLKATLTSLDTSHVQVAIGQDTLSFAPVPANSQITSSNTFTILTDSNVPVDFSKLKWTIQTSGGNPRRRASR